MSPQRKKVTKRSEPLFDEDDARNIYERLDAMERSLSAFNELMSSFVVKNKDGYVLRAAAIGTPAAALNGRVGLAAKRSGWELDEWRAKFGDRTSRLNAEEMATLCNDQQRFAAANHKQRAKKMNPRRKKKST